MLTTSGKPTMTFFNKLSRSGLFWVWIAMLVVFIDRLAKSWVLENLMPYESLRVLPIFNLTLAFNKGMAFSFLNAASGWQNLFLGSLAVIISLGILIWLYQLNKKDYCQAIALSLILGGALGNLWDRLTYESVVDFFDFHLGNWHFAIFNTADAAICLGAFMMMFYWLFVAPKT